MGRKRGAERHNKQIELVAYPDDEGNVLRVRGELSPGSIRAIRRAPASAAASAEDAAKRRAEILFERLVASWEIAGLPLDDQKLLLGRYRMATAEERRWVDRTLAQHAERHLPELGS